MMGGEGMRRALLVDGMLSGTGIRDPLNGGFIDLAELELSPSFVEALDAWVADCAKAHFQGHKPDVISALDQRGMALAIRLAEERAGDDVGYYSDGLLKRLS